jgi:DHA2 family multidrug resistance protein
LVQKLNPLDPNYTDWLAKAQGAFAGLGDPTQLPQAILYSQVQRQAAMLGFLDVFRSLMVLIIVLLPVVIFMRSGKGASGGMGH